MFLIYILVACIIDGISNPFVTAVGATGKIQKFQTIVGIVKLLIIPVCYLFLHEGCGPETLFSDLYNWYCFGGWCKNLYGGSNGKSEYVENFREYF